MIGFERTIFGNGDGVSDGRAVTDTDLNDISTNGTRRAWEVPGYASLTAFDEIDVLTGSAGSFNEVFSGEHAVGRYGYAFVVGPSAQPIHESALETSLGSGMIGVLNTVGGVIVPPAQGGATAMLWARLDGSDLFAHTAEAAGYKRWDLVTVAMDEVAKGSVLRHWEDAITGEKTSQSVVTAMISRASFSLHSGTHSNADGETLPLTPTGRRSVYAVRVNAGTIDKIFDLTIPVGKLRTIVQHGMDGMFLGTNWSTAAVPGWAQASATSRKLLLFPPGLSSDGSTRLLAVRLGYTLSAGASVDMVRVAANGDEAVNYSIATSLTRDGSFHETMVDLRFSPMWGGGWPSKTLEQSLSALALRVLSGGSSDVIGTVEWMFV